MLHFAIALGQPGAHFAGVIFERAVATLVGDAAARVDDVEPLRPSRVSVVGCIVHFIDAEGERKSEAPGEIVSDHDSLGKSLGLDVTHIVLIFFVRFHSPLVDGMRFTNVDCQEIDALLVIVIDLYDIAQPATKGRSSEATEDEHQRPPAGAFMKAEAGNAIERHEPHIRGEVADL
jgi:hypothetical protein